MTTQSGKIQLTESLWILAILLGAFFLADYSLQQRHLEASFAFKPVQGEFAMLGDVKTKDGIDFGDVLTEEDVTLYNEAFLFQSRAQWQKADDAMGKISNPILMGYVLAQRYLSPSFYTFPDDLRDWMDLYSDHPQAHRIYKLASKKDPTLKHLSKVLRRDFLFGYGDNNGLSGSIRHYFSNSHWWHRRQAKQAWYRIHDYVELGWITKAYKALKQDRTKSVLSPFEQGLAKLSVASGYYAYGRNKNAFTLAKSIVSEPDVDIPDAYWVAGIAAWRLGKYEDASYLLSKLARVQHISDWERAASAFWAYRAFSKLDKEQQGTEMLRIAAKYPRTFYGILAVRALGQPLNLTWEWEQMAEHEVQQLARIPAIQRSIALLQIGKKQEAELELRKFYPKLPIYLKERVLAFAREKDLPALQLRMASMISGGSAGYYDHASYPLPEWRPPDGFRIDPALIFGLVRHESGFNARAKSHVGAKGVMQLMPDTAAYIASKNNRSFTQETLFDPEKNMLLGQYYVEYLLSHHLIGGNIFFLAAAYNAGPNKLGKWLKNIEYDEDPLLFVESIPSRETRNFVEQVIANYWIYRDRLGDKNRSIDAVLEGKWPLYSGYEKQQKRARSRGMFSMLQPAPR